MSQLESFDPHPGSPTGGPTRAVKTSIPGVDFADLLPAPPNTRRR